MLKVKSGWGAGRWHHTLQLYAHSLLDCTVLRHCDLYITMEGSYATNSSLGDSTLTTDVSSYTTEILDPDQQSLGNGAALENLALGGLFNDCVIINPATVTIPPTGKTPKSEEEDAVVDGDDDPCRWGPLAPKCCQRFRNAKMVLVCLCLLAIVQVTSWSYCGRMKWSGHQQKLGTYSNTQYNDNNDDNWVF